VKYDTIKGMSYTAEQLAVAVILATLTVVIFQHSKGTIHVTLYPYLHDMLRSPCSSLDADVLDSSNTHVSSRCVKND